MDLLSKIPILVPQSARNWRGWAGRFLLLVFAAFVLAMLVWQARQVEWDQVWRSLRETPLPVLLAAAGLALCGHLLYSAFDLLGRRYTGHALGTLPTMGVTFVSYAFNLNFGAIVGGAAMRFRLYARLGLAVGTIARVMALSMWTNWLGYLFLAGALLLWLPLAPPPAWPLEPWALHILGALLLGLALGYVLLCATADRRHWQVRWRTHRYAVHLPTARMALLQLLMASGTWLLMAGVLYVMLQQQVAFSAVASVHLLGMVSGLVARVPAGLGVQEAVFVALLSHQVPQPELLAALLGYRAFYYWAPLGLALLAYLWMEARARRMTRKRATRKRN